MVMVSVPLFPASLDIPVLLPLLLLGLLRDLESVALMLSQDTLDTTDMPLTLMLTIVMAMDIPMLTMVTMGMDVDTTGVKSS